MVVEATVLKLARKLPFSRSFGKSGLYQISNDNGTQMASFAAANSLGRDDGEDR